MSETHKVSSLVALAFLFLLPIFFAPGGFLSLDVAKSALIICAFITIVLIFLWETWKAGKLEIAWHPFILAVVLLPLVYLLSSFLATPYSLSLLGYDFEVGTFGFVLLGSAFLVLVSVIFSDSRRLLQALGVSLLSFSLVAIFVAIKIIWRGDILVFGNFFGNMGNPIGSWTDLAVSFGLLSASSALALGVIPMKKLFRVLFYSVFVLALALMVVINFSTAFGLTLGTSVFLFLYFSQMEKHFLNTASALPQASANFFLRPIFLPIVLGIISLVFLINPTISETRGTLGEAVVHTFKVENADVRPSLSATLTISKEVLSQDGFLGSGPNTFGRDWLIYKPSSINTTPFWAVAFPFGVGFIPTQIASTGMLGTALWLVFFIFLAILGVKGLNRIPESRTERFLLVSTFLATFFLWISSFLYTPSATLLILSFLLTGFFISIIMRLEIIPFRVINFKESPLARLIFFLLALVIVLGVIALGYAGLGKTVSAFYFKRAVELSNKPGVSLDLLESELNRAIEYSELDIYFVALSRVHFAKAQVVANATTGSPDENRKIFEESLRKSIEAARSAVSINSASYQNWVTLGLVYGSLVPKPLSVVGAYENASLAFTEASKRNPNSPELALWLARLEYAEGNVAGARTHIMNAIALKADYTDAYLMLAQLEIQGGNIKNAIASAERLVLLVPDNPGLYFELGLLKYTDKDFVGAEETLTRALSLAPDYANAKYYLGLTLVQLGRSDEARKQFESLLLTNSDSAEVKAALKSLDGKRKK